MENFVKILNSDLIKLNVIKTFAKYWKKNSELISNLPITKVNINKIDNSLKVFRIKVPKWANSISVDGCLIAPREICKNGKNTKWEEIDWFLCIFLLNQNIHERKFEIKNKPIHSYSYKLKEWDKIVWDYAWTNRISIFLREWVAYLEKKKSSEIFGNIPEPIFYITHDVDAVNKNLILVSKQLIFNLYNIILLFLSLNIKKIFNKLFFSLKLIFTSDNYNCFSKIIDIENKKNIKSTFFFYSKLNKSNIIQKLFDPSYNINSIKFDEIFNTLKNNNNDIGFHPSFQSWNNLDLIKNEKINLEKKINNKIIKSRQHWLRFDFQKVWKNLDKIGIKEDYTLGFNDYIGFRNSSAISFKPLNFNNGKNLDINSIPLVLMDSHLYDYYQLDQNQIFKSISRIVNEVNLVGGEVSIVWHQRVFSKDYNWNNGFNYLINKL